MLKFKQPEVQQIQTLPLKIFCYSYTTKDYNKKFVNVYVAAETKENALSIITNAFSSVIWKEKTRSDYNRQDHWEAWVDHNRDIAYNKFKKAREKEKEKFILYIKEIPNIVTYIKNPGIFHTEYIKL